MLKEYNKELQDLIVSKIQNSKIYDGGVVAVSRLDVAHSLSELLGREVLLKREDTQSVHSFKLRGALQMMMALDTETREKGVIAASAGNHAQGVALAAAKLGIHATIVMPVTTPDIKINAVKRFGGEFVEIVRQSNSFPEALKHALDLAEQKKLVFVHPYDNPDVIAGQGTTGKEILEQREGPIEAIFVPVGGGGLISGTAAYVKRMRPDIKIIGVESEGSACFSQALQVGERKILDHVDVFVDGLAVAQVGEVPYSLRGLVDEIITVSNDEVCAAIMDVFNDTHVYPETAGAVSVAGMKKYAEMHKDDKKKGAFIGIVSGANMDPRRLGHVIERAEVYNKREMLLAATIPEAPGALLNFCTLLGNHNITEFNYRYSRKRGAHIFVGVQVKDYEKDGKNLLQKLKEGGFSASDLTTDDLARDHIRHMVGGRPMRPIEEAILSFEFPERPRALLDFLTAMNHHSWNISLFHYRNHGADPARVLIGWQVPTNEREAFLKLIDKTGFNYKEETDNPAFRLFLDHIKKEDAPKKPGMIVLPPLRPVDKGLVDKVKEITCLVT